MPLLAVLRAFLVLLPLRLLPPMAALERLPRLLLLLLLPPVDGLKGSTQIRRRSSPRRVGRTRLAS